MHIGCIREPAFRRGRFGRCFRVPGERSLREVPRLNLRVLQTYSHGELHHQPSGVNYRIYSEDGKVWSALSDVVEELTLSAYAGIAGALEG